MTPYHHLKKSNAKEGTHSCDGHNAHGKNFKKDKSKLLLLIKGSIARGILITLQVELNYISDQPISVKKSRVEAIKIQDQNFTSVEDPFFNKMLIINLIKM